MQTTIFAIAISAFVAGCHSQLPCPTTSWKNLELLQEEQKQVLAEAVSYFIGTAFASRLQAELTNKKNPRIPLFPNFPQEACDNATNLPEPLINLQIPGLGGIEFTYNRLTDQHITRDGSTDNLDILLNPVAPYNLSISWNIKHPHSVQTGDHKFELKTALGAAENLTIILNSRNLETYDLLNGFGLLQVDLFAFPANETKLKVHSLDINFGSENLTWIADWQVLIQPPDTELCEGRFDLGTAFWSLITNLWALVRLLLNGILTCMVNYMVNDCTLWEFVNQQGCFKADLENSGCLGIPTKDVFPVVAKTLLDSNLFSIGECPAETEPTTPATTTTTTTTQNPNDSGATGLYSLSALVMVIIHFFGTRIVL